MMSSEGSPVCNREPSSFRDPDGYVVHMAGRVFRALSDSSATAILPLIAGGELESMADEGMVVPTRVVEDDCCLRELQAQNPGYERFLEHDRLSQITYPYEWTVSMLADAAVLTLDLQMRLLRFGLSLKDASAYNVQFVGSRPVFIDLSSVYRPDRLDVWYALGQFHRMFTFPLLLCCHYGWDLRSYFLPSLDGRDLEDVARVIRGPQRVRPGMLLDFTLPLLLSRWAARQGRTERLRESEPGAGAEPQMLNLGRLRKKVARLARRHRPRSAWTDYSSNCSYRADAEQGKKALVRRFLEELHPSRVLDLGSNTGEYSAIAAQCGAEVLAADSDHDAVEALYRKLRHTSQPITPLVVDAANPSPAIGYLNCERAAFLDRLHVDCVLALALVHHLMVAANLPIRAVFRMLSCMTERHLIVEFVPKDDPMFQCLLRFRVDTVGDLDVARFREALCEFFEVVQEVAIPQSARTLFLLRKRT